MKHNDQFKFSPSVLLWPLAAVLLLWIVYWVEVRFHIYLSDWGIQPRTLIGLRGILFSPFLHGSLEHIYNNSIPLFVLIAAMLYFYRAQALKVIGYGILLSGFITWLIGGDYTNHIGASGLIYVLVSFIFFKGIQTRYFRLVALSLTVVVMYGGMIWYVFPGVEQGVSWEGHLGGFISGLLFSRLYETPDYEKDIVYDWQRPDFDPQQDAFMKRFDENGNFVNPPPPEPEPEEETDFLSNIDAIMQAAPVRRIVYIYKEEPKNESQSKPESESDS
ncbi:rhomboid family intramembrane serine protease [Flavobacterium sp. Sd200]|uniref:rhomboid family intramembrane serine protease n=1 Tax=Flavobacterium sp. Sd200 TaxID=2692211 RepID=UPI00136C7409|nr:rhomboid family intramembrane serine protease [Flavobacterium sp. Sd200]MXN91063.1 rhomboid family intramembrane serine protease [Flavobacterium sp. Sd200]